MHTTQTATTIKVQTDDGWQYCGYRTTHSKPHHWAAERVSPDGVSERLKLYPSPDAIRRLAEQHEPQQKPMFDD